MTFSFVQTSAVKRGQFHTESQRVIYSWGSAPDPERGPIAGDCLAFGAWGETPSPNHLCVPLCSLWLKNNVCFSVALCDETPPTASRQEVLPLILLCNAWWWVVSHRCAEATEGDLWLGLRSAPDPESGPIAGDCLVFGAWGKTPSPNRPLNLCVSVTLCDETSPRYTAKMLPAIK